MQLSILILIAVSISKCSALECYKCVNCRENFMQKPPEAGCLFCQTKKSFEDNELKAVSRDCVQKCTPSNTIIKGEGDRVECCATNLCNSAHVKVGNSIVIFLLFFTSFILL
ncbi:Lymphocyte antigen [Sparganum proliferum]